MSNLHSNNFLIFDLDKDHGFFFNFEVPHYICLCGVKVSDRSE
jgi:hypothetical protein